MPFHIYPDPPNEPLELGPSALSSALDLEVLVTPPSGGFATMFLRLIALGPPIPAGNEPSVLLTVGAAGTETEVLPGGPFNTPVSDGSDPGAVSARLNIDDNNMYVLEMTVYTAVNTGWQIRIRNRDTEERRFTWVVASSDAESRQPWVHAETATLNFDQETAGGMTVERFHLTGETSLPRSILVHNFGTGEAQITTAAGPIPGSNFELGAIPPPIPVNGVQAIPVVFHAPATSGTSSTTITLETNDPHAMNGFEHNNVVNLSASARQLEIALVLDASGSMLWSPDGTNHTPSLNLSRWGNLQIAVSQFLALCNDFVPPSGTPPVAKGRLGVAIFPDATTPGGNEPSSTVIFEPADILESNLEAAGDAVNAITPLYRATPMGDGLHTAMGPPGQPDGMFLGPPGNPDARSNNLRWVVLMSDGAHNSGPPNPPDFYEAGPGTNDRFHEKNIRLIGMAYGVDGAAPDANVDKELMETLATESGAPANAFINIDAAADDFGGETFKAFRQVLLASLALYSVDDPAGVIEAGGDAQHKAAISHYDRRVSFVVNWQHTERRVRVALLTPNCELITPSVAANERSIHYRGHSRYALYTIDEPYLRNDSDPARPRHGEWRLIVSFEGDIAGADHGAPSERLRYEYEVITDSAIKLEAGVAGHEHYAGEPVKVVALLTANGVGIKDASVTLHTKVPRVAAHNWIAKNSVTQEELNRAREFLRDDPEATPISTKAQALRLKGVPFPGAPSRVTQTMTDPESQGTYTATITDTGTPGTRKLHVVAIGTTEDGVAFRREGIVQVQLRVRPKPEFTRLSLSGYRSVIIDGQTFIEAQVKAMPRDEFGNVILVNPEIDQKIQLVARGAREAGPLVSNVDGSYTQTFRFDPGSPPTIHLRVGGADVTRYETPELGKMIFVDKVIGFKQGKEAVPGANRHLDPNAVLGPPDQKGPGQFLSLGAGGSVTLGLKGRMIGGRALTVFVHPDDSPRSYLVEVLLPWVEYWLRIGQSDGDTQTFSLLPRKPAIDIPLVNRVIERWLRSGKPFPGGLKAVRITDTSGKVRNEDGRPSESPGVSLLAVGFEP